MSRPRTWSEVNELLKIALREAQEAELHDESEFEQEREQVKVLNSRIQNQQRFLEGPPGVKAELQSTLPSKTEVKPTESKISNYNPMLYKRPLTGLYANTDDEGMRSTARFRQHK
jgi:hypothetical protein